MKIEKTLVSIVGVFVCVLAVYVASYFYLVTPTQVIPISITGGPEPKYFPAAY